MTDPIRHNWPQIIRELEAAGYTTYKIALCIGRANGNRVVENWRDNPQSPGPRHYEGELLLALHAEVSNSISRRAAAAPAVGCPP